jgi:predicted RNA-binding Zn ribbon-like protein
MPETTVAPGALDAEGVAVGGPAADLGRIAGALPTRLVVSEDGQVAAAPAGTGPAAALARILLITAEASVSGTWARLKVCSADECRWAFYDRSPTRNGCWCSMAVCGARAKSRAYRRRAAARR